MPGRPFHQPILNAEQRTSYGHFYAEPNDVQLAHFFMLDEADMDFINNRRGRANRLAVALLISSVRFLGTWPHDLSEIPDNILWFVARQLGISDMGILSDYSRRIRFFSLSGENTQGYQHPQRPYWHKAITQSAAIRLQTAFYLFLLRRHGMNRHVAPRPG